MGRAAPRRAGPADADQVTALWLALTESHAERDPSFALVPGAEAEAGRLVGAMLRDPDTALFVTDDAEGPDGALSGLCIVRVQRAPPIHAETRRAEITDLFVADDRRRHGLGSALARAAYGWARDRGAPRVEVRVTADNETGRAFWRDQGFGAFMDVLHRRL